MNTYNVRFQLVDSPADQSKSGGSVDDDGLVSEFRKFPFADEVKRAETIKGDVNFPTLTFKRESDGEEIAIWTENAERFDLCLVRDSTRNYLRNQTKAEVEAILVKFKTASLLDLHPVRRGRSVSSEARVEAENKGLVIYDGRVRWVAAVNLAFVPAGLYVALRFVPGFGKYFIIAFLSLFSLFWIKDFLFGFRFKLASDGRALNWQEGKQADSVGMDKIARIVVEVGSPGAVPSIRFQQTDGEEKSLPPNIIAGLRARDWRHLRQLIAHVQTLVPTVAVDAGDSGLNLDGEPKA
jgi:hypothetical protein